MDFIKLENLNSKYFKESWEIYNSSFPIDEKRDLNSQEKIFIKKNYAFCAILNENKIIGILSFWDLDNFLFIEHLAVKENQRNKGFGTKILKKFLVENNRTSILEVEKPNTAIDMKRIRFYEKLGFALNKFDYIQPSYGKNKKPVQMILMTYPNKKKKNEFSLIMKKIHLEVYGLKKPLLKIS